MVTGAVGGVAIGLITEYYTGSAPGRKIAKSGETGKTTVMAMLIAWQTVNAVRRPDAKNFTRGFLVMHGRPDGSFGRPSSPAGGGSCRSVDAVPCTRALAGRVERGLDGAGRCPR